jgi:starvation-inducible DNA-binding protein
MLEGQYSDLWQSLDDIAERIGALGYCAPGTCATLRTLSTVRENEDIPSAEHSRSNFG